MFNLFTSEPYIFDAKSRATQFLDKLDKSKFSN